jgi:hypothetical protein
MNKIIPRAFISYSSQEKQSAAEVQRALSEYCIEGFLAHEDISVSVQWKERIVQELEGCGMFIALISKAFKESAWAPQELGYAVSRKEMLVLPVCLDETVPFGFIEHLQGRKLKPRDRYVDFFREVLLYHFPRITIPVVAGPQLKNAGQFRYAEEILQSIVPYFNELTNEEAQLLAASSVANNQVWNAAKCRDEYLPKFLVQCGQQISPETYKALEFQVKESTWFQPVANA